MNYEDYLYQHGISTETASRFGLYGKGNSLFIPILDENGKLIFNKERILNYQDIPEGRKFRIPPGEAASKYLFNTKALESEQDYIIIASGEPDVIALDQIRFLAISSLVGEGNFPKEYIEKVSKKKVFLLMDSDEAGVEATAKLKEIFPNAFIISLPSDTKDVCEYLVKYSRSDFAELFKKAYKSQITDFQGLCETFDEWLLLPDKNVLKVVMATVIAHTFSTDPLWLLLIAPPSGTKTEIIQAISVLPSTYFLSDLTAQTFVSGFKAKDDPSLLTKLKNEVLLMKDFTTVLSMRSDDRAIILSQLREIYDGKYSKNFGTGKRVEWEGKLGFIGGVTTIVDTFTSVFQVMGERFILYRVPQPDDEESANLALSRYGKEKIMRQELKEAVKKFYNYLKKPKIEEIILPKEIVSSLSSIASFVVKARSGILRDYRREIEYIPEPEAPARFAKQLGTFIKGLAVVEGKSQVTWDELLLTLKIALDAIPTNRMKHITVLARDSYQSTKQIAEATKYSIPGSSIILEDLRALGLVSGGNNNMGVSSGWDLSNKSLGYFAKFLPQDQISSDKVREYFKDSSYLPLIERVVS